MAVWFASSALGRLRDRTMAWCHASPGFRDLWALPQDESDRVLKDIDLSLSDMAALTHPGWGPSVLLPKRLEMQGVDPVYLEHADPSTFYDLQLTCVRCTNWRRCARDLARGDVQSGLENYCLNGPVLDTMMFDRCKESESQTVSRQ